MRAFQIPTSFILTTSELSRVLKLKVAGSHATCFVLEYEGRQYIVTARHCLDKLEPLGGEVEILINRRWKKVEVRVLGVGTGEVDVAVLAADVLFPCPARCAQLDSDGLLYGQDVRFIGFPLGLSGSVGAAFQYQALPFVKQAIVSCIPDTPVSAIVLDGFNVDGFSGGPMYFVSEGELKIGGVISNYRHKSQAVVDGSGNKQPLYVQQNTGLMVAYSSRHVMAIIEENPQGMMIPLSIYNAFTSESRRRNAAAEYAKCMLNIFADWGISQEDLACMTKTSMETVSKVVDRTFDEVFSERQMQRIAVIEQISIEIRKKKTPDEFKMWVRKSARIYSDDNRSIVERMFDDDLRVMTDTMAFVLNELGDD